MKYSKISKEIIKLHKQQLDREIVIYSQDWLPELAVMKILQLTEYCQLKKVSIWIIETTQKIATLWGGTSECLSKETRQRLRSGEMSSNIAGFADRLNPTIIILLGGFYSESAMVSILWHELQHIRDFHTKRSKSPNLKDIKVKELASQVGVFLYNFKELNRGEMYYLGKKLAKLKTKIIKELLNKRRGKKC